VSIFVIGLGVVIVAFGAFAFALFGGPAPRIAKRRRTRLKDEPEEPLVRVVAHRLGSGVDAVLKKRGWAPFNTAELDLADVSVPVGLVVSWIVGGAALALLAGWFFSGPLGGVMLALLVPLCAKFALRRRARKRRKAFAGQLDNALRIVSSALRAGHSLPTALASVAGDANPPMSEELTRVINENQLGRDLVEALRASADRMHNEDLEWFAGAVAVQRDAGGNLNDIITTVAETIRERAELRQKITAYAAEGKMSSWVLMGLPVVLGIVYELLRPGYLDPMFGTTVGRLLVALTVLLYVAGYSWTRSIVNIKV
jgi:tight adherence protein B